MKAVDPETHYPIVKLHRQMFLWSALLLGSVIWMFWADYNREWKKYQREFFDKEHARARTTEQEVRSRVDPEMTRLQEALAQAEETLKAQEDEIEEIQKVIDEHEVERVRFHQKYLDADQQVKSAKYLWDEAEHEIQQKRGDPDHAAELKRKYEDWVARMAEFKKKSEEAQTAKAAAEAKRKEIEKPALDLRERIRELELEIARLQKRLTDTDNTYWANRVRRIPFIDMLNPDIKIKQVQIDALTDDYYFAKVGHVDRCHTCHLAIDRKGYENEKQPLRTHPRLDLYVAADSKHPLERYGCTICHSGSGRSCSFTTSSHTPPVFARDRWDIEARWEKEHNWHIMHYWDDPQLPSDLITSACWKCHKQETELEGAEPWNEGRKVFERAGCFACHRTQGFETARRPGPSLYHIGDKTSREWAYRWILDPSAVRPDTRMPRFFGINPVQDAARDRAEAAAIVEYIFSASEPLGGPAPTIPQEKADVANGKKLVETVGCLACHSLEPRPEGTPSFNPDLMTPEEKAKAPGVTYHTTFGPVLAGIGSKTNYAWLWRWVQEPTAHFPETRMPDLRLTDREAADIAAFLMTLKDEDDAPVPPAAAKDIHDAAWEYLRARRTLAEVGERDAKPPESYGEALAHEFFAAQVMGATTAAEIAIGGRVSRPTIDKFRGRLSLMAAAGVWKDAETKFDEVVTRPLAADLKDEATMKALEPGLARAKAILADWSKRLVAADLQTRERLYLGDRMVNRYGCFSCHSIRGFELTTPIGRDFTGQDAIGSKDLAQIDFGFMIKDGEIRRKDRWDWMDLKIKEPRIFDRGYSKKGDERLRMPKFHFTEVERQKLIVFLASLVKTEVPLGMQKRLNEREAAMERGRTLVRERNCAACHRFTLDKLDVLHTDEETGKKFWTTLVGTYDGMDPEDQTHSFTVWEKNERTGHDPSGQSKYIVEADQQHRVEYGFGGDLVEVLLPGYMKKENIENPAVARTKLRDISPPILVGEGKKVRPEWLFQFLKEPVTLRGFLEVRMPTFGLTDEEATDLARWFALRDGERFPYEHEKAPPPLDDPHVQAGKAIFEAKSIDCISCHVVTGKPDSGGTTKAPDLNYSKDRLKDAWMMKWLENPSALQPGTRMPKFNWGPGTGFPGDAQTQMRQVVDYLRRLEVK